MSAIDIAALEAADKEVDKFLEQKATGKTEPEGDGAGEKTPTGAPDGEVKPEGDGSTAPEGEEVAAGGAGKAKEEAPAPLPETVPKAEYDRLQRSHEVLQSKYNVEVAPLMRRVSDLERQLAAKEAAPAPAKPTPAVSALSADAKAKMVAEFGEEFVQHQEAIAQAQVAPLLETIGQLQQTIQALQQGVSRGAETAYEDKLFRLVPSDTFAQLNADPAFQAYLAEEEGNTGMRRYDVAKGWESKGAADRVARYYLDYQKKAEGAGGAPAGTPPVKPPAKPSKAALVAPTSTPKGGSPAGAGTDDGWVKESEIVKLAQDINAKVYVGKEAELKKIQDRHDTAQAMAKIRRGQ